MTMTTETNLIRQAAATIVAQADAIDALPQTGECCSGQCPQSIDCLPGIPDNESQPFSYHAGIEFRISELQRLSTTIPDGAVQLYGCSFTNYIASPYVSHYCVNYGISGIGLRHLAKLLRSIDAPHSAGVVVFYGILQNSIGQEMGGGLTESQMYGNIDYMLDKLSNWVGGKVVFVLTSNIIEPYTPDPNLTNTRINQCNQFVINRFGNKTWCKIVNPNTVLAPSGSLLPQYSEVINGQIQGSHLNRAGIDVVFNMVKSKLSEFGVNE